MKVAVGFVVSDVEKTLFTARYWLAQFYEGLCQWIAYGKDWLACVACFAILPVNAVDSRAIPVVPDIVAVWRLV